MGLRGGCARASAANPLLKWRRRRRLLQPRNNDAVTAAALARSQERHADGARALRGAVVFAGCEKARAGPVAASAAWGVYDCGRGGGGEDDDAASGGDGGNDRATE